MQAYRSRQFVIDHLLIAALVFAIAVSGITLVITLTITGDLLGSRQTGGDNSQGHITLDLSESRSSSGAGEGWIGSGSSRRQEGVQRGISPADSLTETQRRSLTEFDRMEQSPGLHSVPQGAPGPDEGLNDYRFIEENTLLPGADASVGDDLLPYQDGVTDDGY